jgi:mannosyltransferase
MKNKITLHLDDIIYSLQTQGGISRYWTEITSRIVDSGNFNVFRTQGKNKFSRYCPVKSDSQIFHSSYYRNPIGKEVKNVVTVHDFTYQHGFFKTPKTFFHIRQINSSINNADAIICVSENTKQDLFLFNPHLKNFPNVFVIPHGANLKKKGEKGESFEGNIANQMKQILDRPYVLFVGRRAQFKNFHSALLGFLNSSLVKLGFSMICVGSKFTKDETNQLNKLNLTNQVFALPDISDKQLIYLYQNAFALIYPSLYEGFGIPPLEAMNLGCPVIASNCSSIPEVVGDAGILIDPLNINSISSSFDILLDENTRIKYIEKGLNRASLFDWNNSAKQYMEIYNSLCPS